MQIPLCKKARTNILTANLPTINVWSSLTVVMKLPWSDTENTWNYMNKTIYTFLINRLSHHSGIPTMWRPFEFTYQAMTSVKNPWEMGFWRLSWSIAGIYFLQYNSFGIVASGDAACISCLCTNHAYWTLVWKCSVLWGGLGALVPS